MQGIIYLRHYIFFYIYIPYPVCCYGPHMFTKTWRIASSSFLMGCSQPWQRQTLSYCPHLRAISSTKGNHLLHSYKQITYWCVSVGIIHFYHTEADQGCHSITRKGLELLWGTSSSATIPISHPSLFCSVPYLNYWKLGLLLRFLLTHTKEDFAWRPWILDHLHKICTWKRLLLHSKQKTWQNPRNLALYNFRGDSHILI